MSAPPVDWHGRPAAEWRRAWGVPRLEIHAAIPSTNDALRERAGSGAPAGTTIIADHQSAGRGRRGRGWTDHPGHSLLLSMLFRYQDVHSPGVLTLRLGLAAAAAVERAAALTVLIKWPNDLLVRERKLGGILCEGAYQEGEGFSIVAGIGLNLTQPDDAWPTALAGSAISLAAAGAAVATPRIAGAVVRAWRHAATLDPARLAPDELAAFARRDALLGNAITVDDVPAGIAAGVSPEGALLARVGSHFRTVLSGTVRTTDEPANP